MRISFSASAHQLIGWFCLVVFLMSPSILAAQDKPSRSGARPESLPGSQAFPRTTWAYLEIQRPSQWLDYVLDHPLRSRIEKLEQVQAYYKSTEIVPLKLILGLLESQIGMTWREMLDSVTTGGVYIGLDGKSQGVLFVSRSRDGETLSKIVKSILGWMDLDAANRKKAREYEAAQHRTHRMIHFAGGSIARVNDWFLASNQQELLKQSMDRLIDAQPECLDKLPTFIAARKATRSKSGEEQKIGQSAQPQAWAFVDLAAIRRAKIAPELFAGRTDNPLGELLLGGVLEGLQQAEYACGTLSYDQQQVGLDLTLPMDKTAMSAARKYFVAEQPAEKRQFLVQSKSQIFHVTGLRDLGGWWHSKEDLFDEGVIAQLALADSQFSTLFASLDFGEEVLTAFEPGLQIIVSEQDYDAAQPDLKLPAIALVGRLKDPQLMKRRLRIAFQSVIGFVNIQSSMNGMPPMDLMTQNLDGIEISSADFVIDQKSPQGVVQFNLSPAVAFVDDFAIISSGRALAQELIDCARNQPQALEQDVNLLLSLQGPALVSALEQNREALIAQNMLEQGSKREAAEQAVGDLLEILKMVGEARSRLSVEDSKILWHLDLHWRPADESQTTEKGQQP